MPGEQVHAPLPTDNAAQAVVATTKIDWLNREIDPNARWKREQRLPKPADNGGDVRGDRSPPRSEVEARRRTRAQLAWRQCRSHAPATALD